MDAEALFSNPWEVKMEYIFLLPPISAALLLVALLIGGAIIGLLRLRR